MEPQKTWNCQSNLQIQLNTCHNSNGVFHRTRTNNPKICVEPQKTLHSQNILEKKKNKIRISSKEVDETGAYYTE